MKSMTTDLDGVLVIQQSVYHDIRGQFMESCRASDFPVTFVQDNVSISKGGVIRGLHYQITRPQAKLVTVMNGAILDVAVDIRVGSPTFGRFITKLLVAGCSEQLFIPAGFAHGFQALYNETVVHYKCSDYYYEAGSRGIRYDDPDIRIPWQMANPTVSAKDAEYPFLKDIGKDQLSRV